MNLIHLKNICEKYLDLEEYISNVKSSMELREKYGMYMLFGESMCSEPSEEEKRVEQMKAERMLKLAQDHRNSTTEIDRIATEGIDEDLDNLLAELGWDVCSQILSTQTSAIHYEPEKIPLFQRRSCLYSDCVPLLDNNQFPSHAFSTLRY